MDPQAPDYTAQINAILARQDVILQQFSDLTSYFQLVIPLTLGLIIGLVAFKLFMETSSRW